MAKVINTVEKALDSKSKRPGIHAKSKTSKMKNSKLYKKPYKGQGK
jgi:hypothetical protein